MKVYLDGDTTLPTLVGTGTEDYLDKPENDLPPLAPATLRIQDMREKVWSKAKAKQ